VLIEGTQYKLADNALFQQVMDEAVILDSKSGQYFTLDAIGTQMVQEISEGKSIQQVVGLIEKQYDASREQITADLLELLGQMKSKGLLIPA
jgi:hypothetical protein